MGGAGVGLAGCASRTLAGGGRSVPEGAAGAAGGGDRDSDSLVRGPAAAPSLSPVLVCPRVSAAAVTVRRRLRRAASGGRAVRGRRALRGGEEGAARRGWGAATGSGSFSPQGSGGGCVRLENVAGCAEKPSARRLPAVRGCGGLGGTAAGRGGAAGAGRDGRAGRSGCWQPCPAGAVPCPGCSSPAGSGARRWDLHCTERCGCRRCPRPLHLPFAGPERPWAVRGELRGLRGMDGRAGASRVRDVCAGDCGDQQRTGACFVPSAGRGICVLACLGSAFDAECHMPFCT